MSAPSRRAAGAAAAALALLLLAGFEPREEERRPSREAGPSYVFEGIDVPTGRPCLVDHDESYDLIALAFVGKGFAGDVRESCEGPLTAGLPEGVALVLAATKPAARVVLTVPENGNVFYSGLFPDEEVPGAPKVARILLAGRGRTLRLEKGAKTLLARLRDGLVQHLYVQVTHDENGPAVTSHVVVHFGRGLCEWPTQAADAIFSRALGKGRLVRDTYTPI